MEIQGKTVLVTGTSSGIGSAIAKSAMGHKRTSHYACVMSTLPPKADIAQHERDVRFVPKADIDECLGHVRFTPKSGHC